jgi:multidrug efflux pump subunit AcrA (membrane-fusion protein)
VQLNIPKADLEVEKQTFEGRIGFVDAQSSPGTDKVRVWAEVDNHDNILRGELLATMTIYPDDVVEPARKESASNDATPEKTSALPANP